MGFEVVPLKQITTLNVGDEYEFIIQPIPTDANYDVNEYIFTQMDATVKSANEGVALMENAPTETLSKVPFKCVIPEEALDDYNEYIRWTQLTVDYQLDEGIFECESYEFKL